MLLIQYYGDFQITPYGSPVIVINKFIFNPVKRIQFISTIDTTADIHAVGSPVGHTAQTDQHFTIYRFDSQMNSLQNLTIRIRLWDPNETFD